MGQHLALKKHKTAKHWQRAATDAPKVSEVRSRELEVEIIDPEEQKRQDEAAEDFFALTAKMNGL